MIQQIPGYQPSVFQLDPVEHDIKHNIDEDAHIKGGSMTFSKGVHINGQISECDELVCSGTLIIGESARVNVKRVQAQVLINLGELTCEKLHVPGTLVAWSGSITGGSIEYAAMEKSNSCKIRGSLDEYKGEVKTPYQGRTALMAVGE